MRVSRTWRRYIPVIPARANAAMITLAVWRTTQSWVVTESTFMAGWWIWTAMKISTGDRCADSGRPGELGGGDRHGWAPWSWS